LKSSPRRLKASKRAAISGASRSIFATNSGFKGVSVSPPESSSPSSLSCSESCQEYLSVSELGLHEKPFQEDKLREANVKNVYASLSSSEELAELMLLRSRERWRDIFSPGVSRREQIPLAAASVIAT
jgi:hypothetical protein